MRDSPVTIAVTRYREPDWLARQALESLASQVDIPASVLFLDQASSQDMAVCCAALSSASVAIERIEIPERSLSYARNRAIALCRSDILLFLDVDAVADSRWAAALAATLTRDGVAAASGRIVPRWHKRPLFVTRARLIKEQYSLLDLGEGEIDADKVIGANFGMNLRVAGEDAYFDEGLGRRGGRLFGGEDTDLSRRLRHRGCGIRYNGAALVHHHVLPERISYAWLFKRLHYAGIGRAQQGGLPGPTHRMGAWDYLTLPLFLPPYVSGYVRGRML